MNDRLPPSPVAASPPQRQRVNELSSPSIDHLDALVSHRPSSPIVDSNLDNLYTIVDGDGDADAPTRVPPAETTDSSAATNSAPTVDVSADRIVPPVVRLTP